LFSIHVEVYYAQVFVPCLLPVHSRPNRCPRLNYFNNQHLIDAPHLLAA